VDVTGVSVRSIEIKLGFAYEISANSFPGLKKIGVVKVSIAGPAGYQGSNGAGLALTEGTTVSETPKSGVPNSEIVETKETSNFISVLSGIGQTHSLCIKEYQRWKDSLGND